MIHNTIKHLPKPHRFALLFLGLVVLSLVFWPADRSEASRALNIMELEVGVKYPVEIRITPSESLDIDTQHADIELSSYTVKRGDTLAKIFSNFGLSPQTTFKVSQASEDAKRLTRMKPNDLLYLSIEEKSNDDKGDKLSNSGGSKHLNALHYPFSNTETLIITASDDGYNSEVETKNIDRVLGFGQGVITSNFWNAGTAAGLSDNKIMELAGIFGWDIDFAQEIREGDDFNVVYEELYIDGEFVGYGDIVAAEFTNQGDTYTAIRYTDGRYYTPEGRSMRKSFLRAPINFKYVSSNFNPRRLHPVQKRIKPHRGVDYVAKIGTPVMAAGDGKVIKSGYDRFNGHHVFLQHGEKYQTKYLHFTKRAVKVGQTVKQGQVIGYLGGTGMVTGAHLHYEFLVDGVHRNPRTVALPKAEPIEAKEKIKFLEIAKRKVTLMGKHKQIMLAKN
ncbi:peptidoglycan DD-metalloendopeptidase family protein [Glaciecola petra]|uniref:Peptidoglycan DD-metalloendopeptidase family protein n=1 Tax=Glaciecola petra TaxID=3075602 RepID=A0ABU2ZTQ4_9ALTE|nr:peptidoglycan DD-metalloendopeptidase family protein [Aestuariibacter sp. P117]MDT0596011.1 peptidoglycan DD-metalloendopeptidase family protein [Aestuariibacter sp. P117]